MSLSEEQRLMRQSCRDFVDDTVIPFIRRNWQREWIMTPEDRLPPEILEGAEKIGVRTLGVPEQFGGIEIDKGTEVQTFALIAEEIARGDSGLADKLVQNWKVAVLLRNLAPRHLQEIWFKRLVEDPQRACDLLQLVRHVGQLVRMPAVLQRGDDRLPDPGQVGAGFLQQHAGNAPRFARQHVGGGVLPAADAHDLLVQRAVDVQQHPGDVEQRVLAGGLRTAGDGLQRVALARDAAGGLAEADHVKGVGDASERLIDLLDELSLAIADPEIPACFGFPARAVARVGKGVFLLRHAVHRTAGLSDQLLALALEQALEHLELVFAEPFHAGLRIGDPSWECRMRDASIGLPGCKEKAPNSR